MKAPPRFTLIAGRRAVTTVLLLLAASCSGAGSAARSSPSGLTHIKHRVAATAPSSAPAPQLASLAARSGAVTRGLMWVAEYLLPPERLEEAGVDGVQIFAEVAITAADPQLRAIAHKHGRALAVRMAARYRTIELDAKTLLTLLNFLIRCQQLDLDTPALVERARRAYGAYPSFWKLAETSNSGMRQDEDAIYAALFDSYVIERVHFAYPEHFKMRSELPRLLHFLRNRKYTSGASDDDWELFQDQAYLMTHVAYALTDYSRLPLDPQQIPWALRFLRENFTFAMADEDVELIGEFVDVFRAAGGNDESDPMVRQGTTFLLNAQHEDGSWGEAEEDDDTYDEIHHTWCAISGLVERRTVRGSAYAKRMNEILETAANFRDLNEGARPRRTP